VTDCTVVLISTVMTLPSDANRMALNQPSAAYDQPGTKAAGLALGEGDGAGVAVGVGEVGASVGTIDGVAVAALEADVVAAAEEMDVGAGVRCCVGVGEGAGLHAPRTRRTASAAVANRRWARGSIMVHPQLNGPT
jgi:hypothetical protein